MTPITASDIEKAAHVLRPIIRETPLRKSRGCSQWLGQEVYLKFENQQMTGSFKVRGAFNKISSLTHEEKKRGIVASSACNHAQGVALAAQRSQVISHIVMPINSPLVKVTATQKYGANVVLKGDFFDEAYAYARELEKEKGYLFVHPYEDPWVIAGQGTIGLEILNDLPEVESIVVPMGGGGLISGIATAIKSRKPQCRIFGVVSENVPGMSQLFHNSKENPSVIERSKKPLIPLHRSTIADGTAVKSPSQNMYQNYISRLVDDVVTVSEEEIAEAMVFLLERTKNLVEGAGAMALAAATQKKLPLKTPTVLVLSGGNVDLNALTNIIEHGLSRRGRLARLQVIVSDVPGTLNKITSVISEHRANILEVYHDRLGLGLGINETSIEFLLETRSSEHIELIKQQLRDQGAHVI